MSGEAGHRIRIDGHEASVTCREGETVLAALHRQGYAVRAGCRRGGCGVCKLDLLEGEVGYTHVVADTVLSEQDRADGVCLACRATPVGDITISVQQPDLRLTSPLFALLASVLPPTAPGVPPTGPTHPAGNGRAVS